MIFEFQNSSNSLSVNSLFCLSLLKLVPVTCQGKEPWLSWDVRVGLIYFSLITSPSSIHLPSTEKYFFTSYHALSFRHCPGCWVTRANKTQEFSFSPTHTPRQQSHGWEVLRSTQSEHPLSLGKRASRNASWRRRPSWDLRGEEKSTNCRGEEGRLF